uniref:Uncharacterized protein n=1 Tax=Timema poppense TaxID=170557 RepID=A0A7R9DFB2_TIMPO|nr:unnamed protein product [Timema poppensis]
MKGDCNVCPGLSSFDVSDDDAGELGDWQVWITKTQEVYLSTLAWRESGKPFWKHHPQYTHSRFEPRSPCSLVSCEIIVLVHAATEAGHYYVDHIVMTPKRKTATSTTLAIERRAVVNNTNPGSDKVHVAGGDHRGIVINKESRGQHSTAYLVITNCVFRCSGLHHSKCSLLVTLVARHRSREWALSERRMYTISWNSDDEDQPMVRVEGYKKGVPATCVSRWVVGSSPGNVSRGGSGSPGWVTTESALEFTVLYTLCGYLALSDKRKGSFPLVRENESAIGREGNGDNSPAQLSLEFRVFLVSGQTGKHTQESRTLQFWFITNLSESDQASVAQEFFKELVSPQEFPRDYIGFIKKVMKLLQHGYSSLKKVEVTLTQLDEVETPPNRPSVNWYFDITLDLRPDLGEGSVSDRSSRAWSARLPTKEIFTSNWQ